MEIELTDEQQFFRDTTNRFLATECPRTTVRALARTDAGFEPGFWGQGAALGWTSLLVSEEFGGGTISGSGVIDLSVVADAFGRHVAPGPLLPTNVFADAVAREGSAAQHAELLPGVLDGSVTAAWCGSELAFDPGAAAPHAVADGEGFVLTGGSAPVEAAAQASHLLVTAAAGDGIIQLVVPADTPGVSITPLHSLDLVRRFARVEFAGARVPATAVLGDPAAAPAALERQLHLALVMQLAEMVGAADVTFGFTVEWAFDRYTFGRPIASYQALKHRFADMKTWLEASHALATALAREVQSGAPGVAETASVAKAFIGDRLALLMQDCLQMHGGIGLTADHDLHLFLRRVGVGHSTFGLPSDHRQRIAGLLALEPAA